MIKKNNGEWFQKPDRLFRADMNHPNFIPLQILKNECPAAVCGGTSNV